MTQYLSARSSDGQENSVFPSQTEKTLFPETHHATDDDDQCAGTPVDRKVLLREQLLELLETMTPREEKVIRLRLGLDDGLRRSREEVAAAFGTSVERIAQIEAKLLRHFGRRPLKRKDHVD